jgi:hypothetical protein
MNARKPPRLANWLLDRLGPARQNPPLAGDLLEEFRRGRSAAWFWRQTLVAILTSLGQSLRLYWHVVTGVAIGWASQAGIAFALWRSHFPPRLPSIFGTILTVLLCINLARILWRFLLRVFRRKPPADVRPTLAEPAEEEDEPDDLGTVLIWFCVSFTAFLVGYCVFGLFFDLSLWEFIGLQATWLFLLVAVALVPDSDPGQVKTP